MDKNYDTDKNEKETSKKQEPEDFDDTIEFVALPEEKAPSKEPDPEEETAGQEKAEEEETTEASPEDLTDLPDSSKIQDAAEEEDAGNTKDEDPEREEFEIDTIEDPLKDSEDEDRPEIEVPDEEVEAEEEEDGEEEDTEEENLPRTTEVRDELSDEDYLAEEDLSGKKLPAARKKKTFKGPKWLHYATKGVKIAVLVILCLVVACVGFFLYEYNRLQKADPNAYTDENVKETVAQDATDDTLKLSEQAMEDQLSGVDEGEAVASDDEIFEDDDVYNILLIGTDDRTEEFSSNARGDTCILLSLNKATGKVSLISFERGTGVPVLWGPYEGQWDWLTHTFRYGGADMMVAEIRENFRVDVNRYIRINIRTLVKLIDAIGGIEVDGVTAAEAEHINNPEGTITEGLSKGIGVEDDVLELHEGTNYMNGATAMVYARMRYIDDDWHRVVRQRKVIEAAANKLSELSATEMISTLDQIVPLVQTDLSETEVAELLTLAPQFMSAEVQEMTIPADGTYGSMTGMGGRQMFAVDFDTNAEIIRDMIYDGTSEDSSSTDSSSTDSTDTSTTEDTSSTASTDETSEDSSSEETLADTPYGNPFNADTRTYNSITNNSSTSSSDTSSSSSYYYTDDTSGDDESIGQLVQDSTTGASSSDASTTTSTDTTTGTSSVSSVLNADGSVTTTNADGSTTVTSTDGTITTVTTDGRTVKTDATGTTVIAYPDGTIETYAADGTTTVTSGSSTTTTDSSTAASSTTTDTTTTTDSSTTTDTTSTDTTTTTDSSSASVSLDTSGMTEEQAAQYYAQYQAQYEAQLAAQQAAAAAAAAGN